MQSVGKDYQKEIEQLLVHELKLCSIVTGVSSGLTVGGGTSISLYSFIEASYMKDDLNAKY